MNYHPNLNPVEHDAVESAFFAQEQIPLLPLGFHYPTALK